LGGRPVSAFPTLSFTLDAACARASRWANAMLLAAVRWSWASFRVSAWSNPVGAAGTGMANAPDQHDHAFRAICIYCQKRTQEGGEEERVATSVISLR
jgi:hypothetical protein